MYMHNQQPSSYHNTEYCPGTLEISVSCSQCLSLCSRRKAQLSSANCATFWTLHVDAGETAQVGRSVFLYLRSDVDEDLGQKSLSSLAVTVQSCQLQ